MLSFRAITSMARYVEMATGRLGRDWGRGNNYTMYVLCSAIYLEVYSISNSAEKSGEVHIDDPGYNL